MVWKLWSRCELRRNRWFLPQVSILLPQANGGNPGKFPVAEGGPQNYRGYRSPSVATAAHIVFWVLASHESE